MSAAGNHELKIYSPSAESMAGAHVQGMAAYEALVQEASNDYEGYWARQARELISWKKPFTQVLNDSEAPFFKWFEDGTLNASYNCLDRHVERSSSKPMTARSPGSPTANCWRSPAGWPMRSRRAAWSRATAWSSTCR